MSGQDILANSGFTGCITNAVVGIGSTSTQLSTASTLGAGSDYAIHGIAYNFADDATFVMSAMAVQAVSTSCLYLLQVNAAGTTSTKKGVERLTADLGDNLSLQWPQPDADNCPLGGFKVALNSSTTFTGATTDLAAAGVTDTYYSFIGGMPNAPQVA